MNLINATKIYDETGVSYYLIRKLTRIGYLQPANSAPPYQYPEDSIQKVLDYKFSTEDTVSIKHLDKRDDEIKVSLQEIKTTLQEILNHLNIPQGNRKTSNDTSKSNIPKERIKELKARQKELQDWSSQSSLHSFSYKRFEELLAVHEELTGDTDVREKFDELGERLRSFVPEYKRLKEESERTGIPAKLSEYVGWTIMNTKNKWWTYLREYLNVKDPKVRQNTEVFFETPFELELGENLPFPDVSPYLIQLKRPKR